MLKKFMDSIYWRRLWKNDRGEWYRQKALGYGVKMGKGCRIMSLEFSSEPYLIRLGDHVLISSHVRFITHEAGWTFSNEMHPPRNIFRPITVGSNVLIGMGAILLPGTAIGDHCIIGAGSVVRGKIPPDSVIAGNPAQVVMKMALYNKMFLNNKNMFQMYIDGPQFDYDQKRSVLTANFQVDG